MSSTCPSCGARINEGQSKCDLCGVPLEAPEGGPSDSSEDVESSGSDEMRACSVCGSANPEGSRFCNQCGSKLPEVRSASEFTDLPRGGEASSEPAPEGGEARVDAPGSDGSNDMAKRVLFTVGAGVLLMMTLYGVTLLSEGQSQSSGQTQANVSAESSREPGSSSDAASEAPGISSRAPASDSGTEPDPEPLSGDLAAEAESLQQSIADASDSAARVDLQQRLVRLYVQAGRQDLAGGVQERIARSEQTAVAWADAGNLYYDWMMQQDSRTAQTQYAKKAISAYQQSLDIDPTNLDVRTDMAVAYLYDPDNPMQAIQQTKKVLEEDPDHIQANFNRGIMLLRINRVEEAVKQFDRVKSLASSDSPIYQRTEKVLQQIRQQQ